MANKELDGKDNTLCRWKKEKGGFRASMFIFVLAALDSMGFVASMLSLVLYFYKVMHFDIPHSANTLTNFMGTSFLLALVGAFVSDTFLDRLTTCLVFGSLEVLALALVTVQAGTKHLHPEACGRPSCVEGGIAAMLYVSLCLLAIGIGGVKGSLTPFGADQFEENDPTQSKSLATFFNWLMLSSCFGATIGVTVVVWVSTEKSWLWGFFISTVGAFVGFVTLALGKPFYRIKEPGESPFARIAQVFVVAFKNRKLSLPKSPVELYEISDKDATVEQIAHTNQMRCLDKAAILPEDSKPHRGNVCTVTQVEEVKILTRMLPILLSTVVMNTCLAQLQTFSVHQGDAMNLKLGSFEVPAASVPVIPLLFMFILIPTYEFLFVPFARKITHHPAGITQLQRVGVGLVLSAISMAVAGILEVKRRDQSRKDPFKPISLFWLSFQYGIFGIADMFTLVGLLEFFYREAPATMKSLSTSFTWLSLSLGYFLSSVFVSIINAVTKRVTPSKQGWLHGFNLDDNNLNLFYWFLAILSFLNFLNYLYWANWYKYKSQESNSTPKLEAQLPTPLRKVENTQHGEAKTKESTLEGDVMTEESAQNTESKTGENTQEQDTEAKTCESTQSSGGHTEETSSSDEPEGVKEKEGKM